MSFPQNPILVTGATGKQGGATAHRLLAAGVAVRALVRDQNTEAAQALAAAGAELALGDFDAPDTLEAALAGTRAVFVVPPAAYGAGGWDLELEAGRGELLVRLARTAGVDQLVFTGIASMGNDDNWGTGGKRRIEQAVIASGLRYTILRPVRFMENYLMQGFPVDGINDGVHRHLFPADRPLQMIAVADVAEFAALAFADPDRFHGLTLEIAGAAIKPTEAAALISEHIGQPVRYEELTESDAAAIGPEIANVWRLSRHTGGWHADIHALRAIHPGLTTLESWLTTTGSAQLKAILAS
ncbi:NmrA family NAD(P)-binding protein [Nocardia sp. XZ_19_385]|uniref:NmrA family NAD(P)-binding protein n=1 Tax=Nocardia sp. XZ_19_385 TaxID=2769488 RepID=UPI00188F6061|nr:NmrA family NAD(P)-binding protein [Nocardia sp. XZ_19_385]